MYNELIFNKLEKINKDEIAISRSTYFMIKSLLIQEGVTDEKEQLHIMKSFNDNYYFSNFKTIKPDDFSGFIIPDKRYSNFSDNKYARYFSNRFGKTETLTNRHHDSIIKATIDYYLGENNQVAYVFSEKTYTQTSVKLLNENDFNNIIVIPSDEDDDVFFFTFNKAFLKNEDESFTEQIIKRIITQFKGSKGLKHILNSLSYSHMDIDVIKNWFFKAFSTEEVQQLKDIDSDELNLFFEHLNFEKIEHEELREIYKSDVERYDDYIIRLEKLRSYYNYEFEILRKTLEQLIPFKELYSVNVKQDIILDPISKFPINNAIFVDMTNIIQQRK